MIYYYTLKKYQRLQISDVTSNLIPLYDIIRNAVVLVKRQDINEHILKNHFRPPIKSLIKSDTRYKQLLNKVNTDNIISLLSKKILANLTYCKKPSFIYFTRGNRIPHSPYYTKQEMINLALNNRLLDKNKNVNILRLCKRLQDNQFQKINILNHANYIQKNTGMYIIRFYTFVGDAFMNSYLRDLNKNEYMNDFIINSIKILWNLINKAPVFSKSFSVYRRIGFDFLSHLKVGDIYTNDSFMSTTRNPLYEPEGFTFGDIVIKINIPKNKKGVGLMTELYSHFPEELEVLIPPNVELKLVKKNWKYYHHNKNNEKRVKTTYEFNLIKVKNIIIPRDRLPVSTKPPLIYWRDIKLSALNLQGKMNTFLNKYTNKNLQFSTHIGKKQYLFYVYFYDSTSVYKDLYKYRTANGISIIHQNKANGQMCTFLELGKDLHVNYHVNYYDIDNCPKFTGLDSMSEMHSLDFLVFLQELAKAFGIKKIIIYPNKMSCSHFYNNVKNKNLYTQFMYRNITYDKDLYNMLVYDDKRFGLIREIKDTYNVDLLIKTKIPEFMKNMKGYKAFNKTKTTNVNKNNKHIKSRDKQTLAELYIYIIKYRSDKIRKYEQIISKYLKKDIFNNYYTYYSNTVLPL